MNSLIKISLLVCFSISSIKSQISISPSLGLSYYPIILYGANTETISKKVNYILGISTQLPIHKKWFVNSAFSYVKRNDVRWTDLCFCPGYLYTEFRHYDINFDFSIIRIHSKYLNYGIGPTVTLKTEEWDHVGNPSSEFNYLRGQNEYLFGLNAMISTKVYSNIYFNLRYFKYLNSIDYFYKVAGSNRVDLTISYKINSKATTR
jgi:hypothetical protein